MVHDNTHQCGSTVWTQAIRRVVLLIGVALQTVRTRCTGRIDKKKLHYPDVVLGIAGIAYVRLVL